MNPLAPPKHVGAHPFSVSSEHSFLAMSRRTWIPTRRRTGATKYKGKDMTHRWYPRSRWKSSRHDWLKAILHNLNRISSKLKRTSRVLSSVEICSGSKFPPKSASSLDKHKAISCSIYFKNWVKKITNVFSFFLQVQHYSIPPRITCCP